MASISVNGVKSIFGAERGESLVEQGFCSMMIAKGVPFGRLMN